MLSRALFEGGVVSVEKMARAVGYTSDFAHYWDEEEQWSNAGRSLDQSGRAVDAAASAARDRVVEAFEGLVAPNPVNQTLRQPDSDPGANIMPPDNTRR